MTCDGLTAVLARAQRAARAPSLSAAVTRPGGPVRTAAVGHLDGRTDGPLATAGTAYRIGSITKSLTAVTVLQRVAAGQVSLTDPVRAHLPELADGAVGDVRVADLLTHTGGLYAEPAGPWWERAPGSSWDHLWPTIGRSDSLGARFHYSNTGFAVLGELVARRTGRSWWDSVRADVLDPLGMTETTYSPGDGAAPGLAVHPHADLTHIEPTHDSVALAPAGQLWSTAADLVRFGQFLAQGDEQVLAEQWRTRMHVPGPVDDVPGARWTRAYGLGLDIVNDGGVRWIGHGGSMPGFVAALRVRMPDGLAVAVLANSTAGFGDLTDDLAAAYDATEPAATSPWSSDPAQGRDLDLTGDWHWGPRPHRLTLGADGELQLSPLGAPGRGSRFVPVAPDQWVGLDGYFAGELLRVHARSTPSPYLDLGTFRFTRTPYDPAADLPGGADPAGWR